jgi:glycerol-3-phosphate acyltransferase PlsY
MLVGLAAFIGHLFPLYHRFAGGKGVATAAGVLVAFNPIHGLATVSTWLIIAFFFRYSSLAALVAAVFAPFYWVLLFGPSRSALVILAMSVLLIWRHRKNIGKLLAGKESRIGTKNDGAPGASDSDSPGGRHRPRKPGHRRIV